MTAQSTTQQKPPRTWRFPTPIVEDQIALALMVWAGFVVTVLGIILGINHFGTITQSVWEPASNAAPWYVAVISGYVLYQIFPMFVAHGRTRRDSALEVGIFVGIFAGVSAFLVTIGYLLELGLYRLNDWPTTIDNDHLFNSHSDIGTIFIESLLTYLVWSAIGAFIGAAFYRFGSEGWPSLIPAALLIYFVSLFMTTNAPFFRAAFERFRPDGGGSLPAAALVSLIAVAFTIGMTWSIVREVPIVKR